MLLGSLSSVNNAPQAYSEDMVLQLIQAQRWSQAYLLLKQVADHHLGVAPLYNLALCQIKAGHYPQALCSIDQALLHMPTALASPTWQSDTVHTALMAVQATLPGHMEPISEAQVSLFSLQVRDDLLRLKIDCLVHTGQWAHIVETAAKLSYKQYHHVTQAVQMAHQQLQQTTHYPQS